MLRSAALSLLLASSVAAEADVQVAVTGPSPTALIESAGTYTVKVNNAGNKAANSVSVTINLQRTNTSPTSYLLGTLSNVHSACTVEPSGSAIVCALGRIKASKSSAVTFSLAVPQSTKFRDTTGDINATVSTTSLEDSTTNNAGSLAIVSRAYANPIADVDRTSTVRMCTGTGLTAFYECEKFPSSIQTMPADIVFAADGSFTFDPVQPGYTGTWQQPSTDRLEFQVFEDPELVTPYLTFTGQGEPGGCFEGLTTFDSSTYVAPYQVCV